MQDLAGVSATTDTDCAAQCDATPACNGASFYADAFAFFGSKNTKNCWLKTFNDSCAPPPTSEGEPLAALLLKPAPECAFSQFLR